MPDFARKNIDGWRALLPGWEVNVITDDDRPRLPPEVERIYQTIPNCGNRSDIDRVNLLYFFGGVYLDWDVIPVKPLPGCILIQAFTISVNRIPKGDGGHILLPEVAFMASEPYGKLITAYRSKMFFELLRSNGPQDNWQKTGPTWLNEVLTAELLSRNVTLDAEADDGLQLDDLMVLPSSSFYSSNIDEPGVLGVHTWKGSWR